MNLSLEQLGARLEQESQYDPKLREDAQLCYIVSGNFDRLVESWSANAKTSTNNLQELVELVMFLQKSIERQGRPVEVSGSLAELLSYYSSLLASQGNLTTALNYLGNSQNSKVASLRERLTVSIGQKPAFSQIQQQEQSRRNSMRQSFSSQQSAFAPVTGLPNTAWQQPVQAPVPPKPFSPTPVAPPPTQPPRPGSGTGLPPRSKYVVDPSVQANPYGPPRNQFSSNPIQSAQPFQTSNFQTNALSNTTNSQLNPSPLVPSFPANIPSFGRAVNTQPSFQNNLATAGDGFPAPPIATEVLPPPLPTEMGQSAMNYLPANAAPGWNDPPVLNKPLRPQVCYFI